MSEKDIYTKEYCSKEIFLAREIFGNKNTTEEQYDAMEKGLSLMYLYCPEEIKTDVYAIISEAEKRRIYFELYFWVI
jgi:hypothetical protein